MLVCDVGLPLGGYYILHALGVGDVIALTAGGLVAGLRAVYTVIRERKLDGFAVFVLGLFAVGVALTFVTGDARLFLLAKDSFGFGLAGLVCLVSCVVGKPLTYHSGRRFATGGAPERIAAWDHKYATNPRFRATLTRVSLLWGTGLVLGAALCMGLVYWLPVSVMVTVNNVVHLGCIAVLVALSMRMVRKAKRLGAGESGAGE